MSRIGKQPIPIPKGVKVTLEGGLFTAEGPKGRVSQTMLAGIPVEIGEQEIRVTRKGNSGDLRSKHGLVRSLLANAVHGVAEGFSKTLEIQGVGYRVELKGKDLQLALGYSHPVAYSVPEGIEVAVEERANRITVLGADRQQVGQVAAEIRSLRKPEPYKGKGIRYVDEVVHRKVGKAGAR